MTKRAVRLVEASNSLAEGKLSNRARLQGSDELAQISAAFDQMADRIQTDTQSLQKSQASLADAHASAIAKAEQLKLAVRIADNGPGITEKVQARLFDPFFTTKPVGKGTGLGLSISYQIVVDKHGGLLKCISNPGQGAEFSIEIPVRQGSRQATSVVSPSAAMAQLGGQVVASTEASA